MQTPSHVRSERNPLHFRSLFALVLLTLVLGSATAQQTPTNLESGQPYKVLETKEAAGYTYAHIQVGDQSYWIAGPQTTLKKGDQLVLGKNFRMKNYHSRSLQQDFAQIYFCSSMAVEGAKPSSIGDTPLPSHRLSSAAHGQAPAAESAPASKDATAASAASSVAKADGGITIKELNDTKAAQKGKTVRIRGEVVKYSPGILGKNWIHIQDATTGGDIKPLVITTLQTSAVGDIITAEGNVRLDHDLGYGYNYPILLEDAKITVE